MFEFSSSHSASPGPGEGLAVERLSRSWPTQPMSSLTGSRQPRRLVVLTTRPWCFLWSDQGLTGTWSMRPAAWSSVALVSNEKVGIGLTGARSTGPTAWSRKHLVGTGSRKHLSAGLTSSESSGSIEGLVAGLVVTGSAEPGSCLSLTLVTCTWSSWQSSLVGLTKVFQAILHFTGTEGNYIDIYINNW